MVKERIRVAAHQNDLYGHSLLAVTVEYTGLAGVDGVSSGNSTHTGVHISALTYQLIHKNRWIHSEKQ